MLKAVAPQTFPTFEKLTARRVFLNDNPLNASIRINVYLNYQGMSRLANTVTFGYDEEEKNHFVFNDAANKSGLQNACTMIQKTFTTLLQN